MPHSIISDNKHILFLCDYTEFRGEKLDNGIISIMFATCILIKHMIYFSAYDEGLIAQSVITKR